MADQTRAVRHEDLTAPELAALDAWNRGSADTTGMLYAVRHALAAAGPTITPDARDRLARHLYIDAVGDGTTEVGAWDTGSIGDGTYRKYQDKADSILAVINTPEGR